MTRQLLVRISDEVSVSEYVVCPELSSSVWRSTSGITRYARKRFDTEDYPAYSGEPKSLYDDVLEYDKAKCGSGCSSLRSAIARALSLASLLGLPARTSCAYSRAFGGHRLIADTGCGKDMVSNYPNLTKRVKKQDDANAINVTGRGHGLQTDLGKSYWHIEGAESLGTVPAKSILARELLDRFQEEGKSGYIPFPEFSIDFQKGKLINAMGASSFKIMWH